MSVPEPPAYGRAPQGPFSPPEAIAWGWRRFTQFLGPVMIGVAIYVACTAPIAFVTSGLNLAADSSPDNVVLQLVDGIGGLVLQIASTIAGWVLGGAAARAALDVADGRLYDFLNALRRIPIGKLIVVQLVIRLAVLISLLAVGTPAVLAGAFLHAPIWILVAIGALVLIPFLFAVALFTYFARWVLVDDPTAGVLDAIGASIRLVRTNLGDTVLLTVLNLLVVMAGLLACCVGLVVAFPVTYFATAHAFRRFHGQVVAA